MYCVTGTLCDYRCARKDCLKSHVLLVHEDEKLFKCESCEKSFSLKGNLNQHISFVHEDRERLFKCKFCDKNFHEKGNLNEHFATVHEGKKPFKC